MKKIICFLMLTTFFSCAKQSNAFLKPSAMQSAVKLSPVTTLQTDSASLIGWDLLFQDEFSVGSNFDSTNWSFCPRANPDWAKYLTSTSHYANLANNNLQLTMDNAVIAGDTIAYHSGGIQTYGKFTFTYGKVQVRAKFTQGQGSWPAIWMMPETATYGGWPNSGEIDIMEHLNNDSIFYQTLHGQSLSSGHAFTKGFNVNQYNTYGIEWFPNALTFYVNDVVVGTYSRSSTGGTAQWPFNIPFYVILNQSGGGSWGGPINNTNLPFNMMVDYIRVYKPDTSIVSEGVYNISTSMNNTSNLDLYNGVAKNGTNIILWHKTGGSNQKWIFIDLGNGYFKIKPVNDSTLALTVPNNVNTAGTQLQLQTDVNSTGQQWKITSQGNGLFTLSPKCAATTSMDASGASINDGTKIIIWTANAAINQSFILRRVQ
ncbi:family 16 glycosylhydrolase [Arachidicoccus sp.]|uniref:family 16 glycosylhydrolase n=1 Tax=Arachidicoccus sp. TaxID=1872624 RepID=UPI003D25E74B